MKIHPVLMSDGRIVADKKCGFCEGRGVYNGELCYCLQLYYGQPLSRETIMQLKQALKKFQEEERDARYSKS